MTAPYRTGSEGVAHVLFSVPPGGGSSHASARSVLILCMRWRDQSEAMAPRRQVPGLPFGQTRRVAASQSRRSPFHPTEASNLPRGLKATEKTSPLCAVSGSPIRCRVVGFQKRMVLSRLAEASTRPSGLWTTETTRRRPSSLLASALPSQGSDDGSESSRDFMRTESRKGRIVFADREDSDQVNDPDLPARIDASPGGRAWQVIAAAQVLKRISI